MIQSNDRCSINIGCFLKGHVWGLGDGIKCNRCELRADPYIQRSAYPITIPQIVMKIGAWRNRIVWGLDFWVRNRVVTCFDCGKLERFFGRHVGDHGRCLRY